MVALFFALALATQTQDAPQPATALPVSIEHIRRGLERTSALRIDAPVPEPTFRVEVVGHPYFLDVPFTWQWAGGGVPLSTPAPGGATPLFQIDVLPWIMSAKRAYAQHAASVEVQRAIAEFCATHACRPQ